MVEPIYPTNDFTQLIERVSQDNARGVRSGVESVISAQNAPTVRSASLGPVVPVAEPLTPEEQAELDAKAMALGLMPGDNESVGAYGTMEDALAAAAPVERPVPPHVAVGQDRVPARAYRPQGTADYTRAPRLPDFSRVQGIDLLLNVVYVDGMAFAIPDVDVREFRVYAMETARQSIMKQFEAALNMLQSTGTGDREDGENTEVHSMRESERDSGSSEGGQSGVRTVPPLEQMDLFSGSHGVTDPLRPEPF